MTLENLIGSGADQTFPTGLSHAEMLTVTGLTNARLMGWYKRWRAPVDRLQKAPGRGIRRRYDVSFALFFLMKRIAADAGIPLEDADAVGGRLAALTTGRSGLDFDRTLSQAESDLTNENPERRIFGMALIVPCFEGAPPQAGESEPLWRKLGLVDFTPGPSGRFAVIALERDITELTLSHWMRRNAMPHGVLIDYWAAAVRFSASLATVLAARKRA